MAETRLSKVLIKQQQLDEQGKPIDVYTEAPFAADIDDFIVYDDNGAANSVKDFVFGATNPGTFESIKDQTGKITTDNSMWSKLNTTTQECYKILDNNKSFWNGLSQAEYIQPSDPDSAVSVNGEYLASGDQINALRFYGEDAGDSMEGEREKLVSLGALEDFAKRIPTMGDANGIALGKGSKAEQENSFAVSGGIAQSSNSIAIGPGTEASVNNQTVIGQYNIPDVNASFILGAGTNSFNRKNAMKVIKNTLCLPAIRSNEEQTLQVGNYFLLRDETEFVFGGKIELHLTTARLTSSFYSIELPLINSFSGESQIMQDKQSATTRMELDTRTYLYAKINYSQNDGVLVINTAELAFEDKHDGRVWTDSLDSITIIVKEKMSINFF